MSDQGFIKLSRKFFKNPLWKEPRQYSRSEAWLDLIFMARFEDSQQILRNRVIEVQRGEIIASRRFLEERWSWGSTKVVNFLNYLQNNGMINQRQTSGQTIIILCNYDTYNPPQTSGYDKNKPETNQSQTSDKPATNQNKEYKEREESKEGKENNISPLSPYGDISPGESVPEEKNDNPVNLNLQELKKEKSSAKKERNSESLTFPYTSEEFVHAWQNLMCCPKWKKKNHYTLQLALNKLARFEEEYAIILIESAATNDWQGVVFPDTEEKYLKWRKAKNTKPNISNHDNNQTYTKF